MAMLVVYIPEIDRKTALYFFSSGDSWKLRDFSSGREKVVTGSYESIESVDDIIAKAEYSESVSRLPVSNVKEWMRRIEEANNRWGIEGNLKKNKDINIAEFAADTPSNKSDMLTVGKEPIEGTIEISEGDCGYSYENLFKPYLLGASKIKLVDPYIRNHHQVQNFIRFSEIFLSPPGTVSLELFTSTESKEEKMRLTEKL